MLTFKWLLSFTLNNALGRALIYPFSSLQVFCVSNCFTQPVDPVVSQEEEASPTSLQENPSHANHYGTTD